MKGTAIFIIAILCTWAALELAPWIERELAIPALVRAAKEEHRRTVRIYEPVAHGDVPALPRSALISRMPETRGM
jgi:hypothetical protein